MSYQIIKKITTAMLLSLAIAAPSQAGLSPGDKTSIKDVEQETRELIKSIKSYSAEQRDQAIQEIEIAVARLDQRIESLQSRIDNQWDEMAAPARQQARASLRTLHQERVELAEWYGNLKGSSAGAWDKIKRGFSRAYSDINKAWEKALNEFDSADNG
jgi:TolA-binding protein